MHLIFLPLHYRKNHPRLTASMRFASKHFALPYFARLLAKHLIEANVSQNRFALSGGSVLFRFTPQNFHPHRVLANGPQLTLLLSKVYFAIAQRLRLTTTIQNIFLQKVVFTTFFCKILPIIWRPLCVIIFSSKSGMQKDFEKGTKI